ncbi:copper-binding protein [Rhodoferax sp. GW822-FHT02A01]|uniref:copper-binding protein n=1 Tax=Rhodoferax sp. GW822-FHT02A01 TaxID=3141537 RepID=UPI00315C6AB4
MKILLTLALIGSAISCNAAEWVRAQIVDGPELHQITLKHEAIKSLGMGAMTMPFQVDERVSLKGFKVGDKVRFRVHADGDFLRIDALVHTP